MPFRAGQQGMDDAEFAIGQGLRIRYNQPSGIMLHRDLVQPGS
jgi:hypothetical protein